MRATIAHEFGHLLGIRHTCDHTLMAGSMHRHPSAHVTATDVASVLQGQFD
ncbi:MAG: matrixin family metalloprotease [Cutibacterium granulosum]|nr:matrixin family metalloprotease [Cutibacterium granulosum]